LHLEQTRIDPIPSVREAGPLAFRPVNHGPELRDPNWHAITANALLSTQDGSYGVTADQKADNHHRRPPEEQHHRSNNDVDAAFRYPVPTTDPGIPETDQRDTGNLA
jgi:hypothetical protein